MAAYWEIIADKLKAAGWSLGWHRLGAAGGVALWQADASRPGSVRFVSRAEVLATAFLELERMIAEQGGPGSS